MTLCPMKYFQKCNTGMVNQADCLCYYLPRHPVIQYMQKKKRNHASLNM